MTMPQHPPLSIKRNTVPLRGLVTPIYLYWYPVSSLRDHLNAACGQSLNSVVFLVILGPSLAFYSLYVYSFPFSSWKDQVSWFHCPFGPWDFFWVVVVPLRHWMLLYCLSACLEHNDWHHWIPLTVLVGALLALAMATGWYLVVQLASIQLPFALLHSSASDIGNVWGHVRLGLLGFASLPGSYLPKMVMTVHLEPWLT